MIATAINALLRKRNRLNRATSELIKLKPYPHLTPHAAALLAAAAGSENNHGVNTDARWLRPQISRLRTALSNALRRKLRLIFARFHAGAALMKTVGGLSKKNPLLKKAKRSLRHA